MKFVFANSAFQEILNTQTDLSLPEAIETPFLELTSSKNEIEEDSVDSKIYSIKQIIAESENLILNHTFKCKRQRKEIKTPF